MTGTKIMLQAYRKRISNCFLALTSSSWKRGGDVCGFGICLRKQAINIAKEHVLPKWHSKTVSKTLSLHQWLSNNSKSRSRYSDITWTAHATFVLLFSFTSFATEISGFYDAYPQTTCTLVKRQRYIDFSGRKIWKYLQKKKRKK